MNSFELSRTFFNFTFENPEKIKPIHSAIYFFAIEHCNRLGDREKFGFPSQMTMEAIGVKNYQTYGKALKDLEDWGFIKFIERSKNQYSANIITIVATTKNDKARGKALDKATLKHDAKHDVKQTQSTVSINKPLNQETKEPKNHKQTFESFWLKYPNKVNKKDCLKKWLTLSDDEINKIESTIDSFIKFKPFKDYNLPHPKTYLNGERWNDEIKIVKPTDDGRYKTGLYNVI